MISPCNISFYANFCENQGPSYRSSPSVVYSCTFANLQRHQKHCIKSHNTPENVLHCDDCNFRWIITVSMPYLVSCCFFKDHFLSYTCAALQKTKQNSKKRILFVFFMSPRKFNCRKRLSMYPINYVYLSYVTLKLLYSCWLLKRPNNIGNTTLGFLTKNNTIPLINDECEH